MKKFLILILIIILSIFQMDLLFGNKKEIWKVQSDYALRLYKEKKYSKALEIERSSLEIAEKTFGKDHPNYISNLNNIGEIYRALNDKKSAEEYFTKAVSIVLKRKKMKRPVSVRYISNLALLYEAENRYEDAEKYQKIAVKYGEEIFGSKSPEFASVLSRMGRIWRKLEKYKEAGVILKKALDINLGNGDKRNKNNVLIYSNLGMNSQESGDFDKAEYYLKKAVSLSKSVNGENGSETARNINNLSALYFKFSKYREARELTEKFIELNRVRKGRDNRMISTGVSNLAAVYYAQKLYNNAENTFLDLLREQEKRLGRDDPVVASTARKLGILYFSWKKYEQSRIFLERSFEIEPLPETNSCDNFFEGRSTLGLTYEKLGLQKEALKLYRGSLELKARSLKADSHLLVPALNDLGIYFFRTGRETLSISGRMGGLDSLIDIHPVIVSLSFIEESGKMLSRGMKIINKYPERTYPDSLATTNYYMEYLLLTGRKKEAGELYGKIVEKYRDIFGKSHLNMTNVLGQFARFCKKTGDLDKALKINKQVIDIFKRNGFVNNLKIVESLRDMGNLLILRREYTEALSVFRKKLLIMEKKFGSDALEIANDVYEVGNAELLTGSLKTAGESYLRVLRLWDLNGGGADIDSVPFLKDISEKLFKTGFKKQWRKLNTRIREILRKEERKRALER
ncbi:MAG: tetratricopeptide repeat protein [Acidobacteriota bacterium]